MADPDSVDLSDDPRATSGNLSVARKATGMKMTVKTTSVLAPHLIPINTARTVPSASNQSTAFEPLAKRTRSDTNGLDSLEPNQLAGQVGPSVTSSIRDEHTANVALSRREEQHESSRRSFTLDMGTLPETDTVILGAYRSAACCNRFRDSRPSGSGIASLGESLTSGTETTASVCELIESCESCQLPISVFGRFVPCSHAPCYDCARRALESTRECAACRTQIDDVLQLPVGALLVCDAATCRRTFTQQRELRTHLDEAHRNGAKEVLPNLPSAAVHGFLPDSTSTWSVPGPGWTPAKLHNGNNMNVSVNRTGYANANPVSVFNNASASTLYRTDETLQFASPTYQLVSAPSSNNQLFGVGVVGDNVQLGPPFDESYAQFDLAPPNGSFEAGAFRMNGRLAAPSQLGPYGVYPNLRPPRPNATPNAPAYLSPPLAQRRPLLPSPPLGVGVGLGVGAPQMHTQYTLRPVGPFDGMPHDANGPGAFAQPFVGLHGYLGAQAPAGAPSGMPHTWSAPNLNMSHNLP